MTASVTAEKRDDDLDGIPTWTVEEAFAAFHQWCRDHDDEVGELDLLDQIEAYHADWVRRNN